MPTKRRPKPLGLPTRGKTALNRLRQIDTYIALAHEETLRGGSPLVVDLGFGAAVWTTLELYERWRRLAPRLHVIGVEIDPQRVAEARPYAAPPYLEFRLGGFNLRETLDGETARLIRAYNVLRQYEEAAVAPALAELSAALEIGGLLIEGTSNPTGSLVAFDLYRHTADGLRHIGLTFGTNFHGHPHPADFQTILPKRLIHRMRDPRPAAFFEAWKREFDQRKGLPLRARWLSAALRLRDTYRMDARPRLLRRGFLTIYDRLRD
ncbi:MAG TPA: class I SAM-dependent methyltransferase [Aggregatilineales bacterium]|nr:class I SAM-dependent methyltransferase [Anaerolineales bacterium]HRE48723.1 class I SAM-dependent methyltransferase [Aggregatilineales bacterium]